MVEVSVRSLLLGMLRLCVATGFARGFDKRLTMAFSRGGGRGGVFEIISAGICGVPLGLNGRFA